jgi:hypothetical protein
MSSTSDSIHPAKARSSLVKAGSIIGIALLPILTLVLFGSFNLYAGNPDEFASGFSQVLPLLLAVCLAGTLVLAVPGLLLRGSARQRYLCLLLGLGVLLWLQGNFMPGDYGVIDGRGIEWQAFAGAAWVDILLWLSVIVIAFVFHRQLIALALPVSLVLVLIQSVAAVQLVLGSDEDLWQANGTATAEPPEGIFHYSRQHNIVHLVLDNFQTDVFEELVEELDLDRHFEGFTLFREAAAVAPYTAMAIPSIFHGRVYDGSESVDAFFRSAMEDGFHARLHDEGYRVNLSVLQSMANGPHDHHYRIPGVHAASPGAIARSEAALLMDVSLFRHSPHLTRNWIYNDHNWRVRQWTSEAEVLPISFAHKHFFGEYTDRIEARLDGPAYHFIHLWPPHPPYVTTATGAYAGEVLPNEREHYLDEARAIVQYTVDFLERLRSLGLYDDALILIHSDHGGAFEPEFTPTRMLSLMAVKPPQADGVLETSSAPVSLGDVAATVLTLTDIDPSWPGRSVFDVGEQDQRVRHYSFWHGEDNRQLGRVLIDGSLYTAESYTYTDSIEVDVERKPYIPGKPVEVGLRGTGSMYLGRGWSTPEPGIVWSNNHEATLQIPLAPQDTDRELSLWLIPAIYDGVLERQRIRLYLEDTEIGNWELDERTGTRLQTTVPAELMQSGELELRFELPDAASQHALGVGGDQRLQAIALIRFLLE